MSKYVYVLVCLAALFGIGYSQGANEHLKCYKCDSETVDGCSKGTKPSGYKCGNAPEGSTHFCYYKTAYDTVRKINYSNSSCLQVPLGSLLDQRVVPECKNPPPNTKITECRVCANDLCNSAPVLSMSLITVVCLPVIYFFSKIMH